MTEDKRSVPSSEEQNLADTIEKLMQETSILPEDKEINGLLKETITGGLGRIVSFHPTAAGWVASVESWDSMRVRQIEKKGEMEAKLTRIYIGRTERKFKFRMYEM